MSNIFRDFFVKQKPVFTGITRGVGGFGFGAAPAADAGPLNTYVTRVLMIGGGGGGGGITSGADGGGGGAGEVKEGELTIATGAYVFRVGDGTPGATTGKAGSPRNGTPTFISSPLFTTVTAAGGGGGATGPDSDAAEGALAGGDGGSGGAGGGDGTGGTDSTNQPRGVSTAAPASSPYYSFTGYGNPGGHGGGDGGGGGGAGAAGTDASGPEPQGATPGGNGQPFPIWASPLVGPACPSPLRPAFNGAVGATGLYGGGGAAGGEGQGAAQAGTGGGGGVGNAAAPGKEFTGGGGSGYESNTAGGNGGCGVIILRIPTANAPNITVPGTVTTATPGNAYKYFFFPGESTTSFPVSVA